MFTFWKVNVKLKRAYCLKIKSKYFSISYLRLALIWYILRYSILGSDEMKAHFLNKPEVESMFKEAVVAQSYEGRKL